VVRGIVFEEDAARDIERRLRADGYAVTVARERLAGEDDDEDHPWAVETDAPVAALELLLDLHDGWLDDAPGDDISVERAPVTPIELPDAPRRRHHDRS
jgi:8-oxo-dGTP diphosphatase